MAPAASAPARNQRRETIRRAPSTLTRRLAAGHNMSRSTACAVGTFPGSLSPHIDHQRTFPDDLQHVPRSVPPSVNVEAVDARHGTVGVPPLGGDRDAAGW